MPSRSVGRSLLWLAPFLLVAFALDILDAFLGVRGPLGLVLPFIYGLAAFTASHFAREYYDRHRHG